MKIGAALIPDAFALGLLRSERGGKENKSVNDSSRVPLMLLSRQAGPARSCRGWKWGESCSTFTAIAFMGKRLSKAADGIIIYCIDTRYR